MECFYCGSDKFASWPSVYLLIRNVYLGLLPIFFFFGCCCSFLIKLCFKIIVDSHAAEGKNTEMPCNSY